MSNTQLEIDWDKLFRKVEETSGPVLVITGRASYSLSGAEAKINEVVPADRLVHFNDFTPNPQLSDIQKGVKVFQKVEPVLLISIGGGSTLDVAKCINFLAHVPEQKHVDALSSTKDFVVSSYIDHIAIPTTFGTGSESTSFATVFVGARKYSLAGPCCLPDYYILDESLGFSASSYTKASCGMDALCQAIESFWAKGATPESQEYARQAIPLLVGALVDFVRGSQDAGVMYKVALGSNLAGKAINLSKTTAPHAISYGITQKFGIDHGQAVLLTLPYFITKNACMIQMDVMSDLFDCLQVRDAKAAVEKIVTLSEELGLKTRLNLAAEFEFEEIEMLADEVNLERLGNHPYPVSREDVIHALLHGVEREE